MQTSIAAQSHRSRRRSAPGITFADGDRRPAGVAQAGDPWKWVDDWIAAALEDRSGATHRRVPAIRGRDAALRGLADRFYPGLSRSAQARKIRQLTVRYAAVGWPRDRHLAAPPPHYAGAPHDLLWRAFAAGALLPISERRLCSILGTRAERASGKISVTARDGAHSGSREPHGGFARG